MIRNRGQETGVRLLQKSERALVLAAQTVIAEARTYTTTEVQYEKNKWA